MNVKVSSSMWVKVGMWSEGKNTNVDPRKLS